MQYGKSNTMLTWSHLKKMKIGLQYQKNLNNFESTNDRSALRSSGLYKAFEESNFYIPPPVETKGFENPLSNYLLDDEIFPLKPWLMRPDLTQDH